MSVLFNNPRLGASGQGPSADLGETIEQSLRFRGGISGSGNGGMLSKTITTSSTTAALTISFWVKLGSIPSGYNRFIFSSGTAGSASGNISYDMGSSEGTIRFQDTSMKDFFRLSEYGRNIQKFSTAPGIHSSINSTQKRLMKMS